MKILRALKRVFGASREEHMLYLPNNEALVKALQDKKSEYAQRLVDGEGKYSVTFYKFALLGRLLESDSRGINPKDIYCDLEKQFGYCNRPAFKKATGIIEDYCNTGGKNVIKGGLRLPVE